MAASEAAVTAVMETLGCSRYRREFSHPEPFVYDYCVQHSAEGEQSWSDRGCPVAVAAADKAVDADRASIQAQALDAVEDSARESYNASTRRSMLGKEWEDLRDSEAGGWVARALRKAMRTAAQP